MRQYRQLTEEDRIEIYAMKQAGKRQKLIAAAIVSKTRGIACSKNDMTAERLSKGTFR